MTLRSSRARSWQPCMHVETPGGRGLHPRDPGRHLARPGRSQSGTPIPLPDHYGTGVRAGDVTTGGFGVRSGVDAVRAR
jgi:hypothetical protein